MDFLPASEFDAGLRLGPGKGNRIFLQFTAQPNRPVHGLV